MSASKRQQFTTAQDIILDFLPYFTELINPNACISSAASASSTRLSKSETTKLSELAKVYLAYGLEWKETKRDDSVVDVLELTPPIHDPIAFSKVKSKVPLPICQLLSSQVIAIRQAERHATNERTPHQIPTDPAGNSTPRGKQEPTGISGSVIPTPLKTTTTPKAGVRSPTSQNSAESVDILGTEEIVEKDFFGRSVVRKRAKGSPSPTKDGLRVRQQFPVAFKYQEGFTNAVKRNVYIKDFL